MIHALHLTTWHPYIDGTAGTFVVEQCAALQAAGAKIGLVFSRVEGLRAISARRFARGWPGFVQLHEPVPTYGFKSWNLPGAGPIVPRLNEAMLCNRFDAYQRALGMPDILHAHVALEAGIATRRIAARTGLNYVVTEHSSEVLNGIRSADRKRAAERVYADARKVLAVSPKLAECIMAIYPAANIEVVGNLVRESVFAIRVSGARQRDRVVIAAVGSLTPNKRVHQLFDAIAGLRGATRDQITCWIVGDGPCRRRLEQQAAVQGVRAHFFGNLPHGRAMSVLGDADMLVHPSAFETFGVVLAEALALGLPVIATRCGGPEQIVTEEVGRLVAVDDVAGLRRAIEEMVHDLASWKARQETIRRYARCRFHEANLASAILETYR